MNLLDPQSLLVPVGTRWRVLLVMFAETGLLVGFFLPGDSLLFTAGLLTTTGIHLSLPLDAGASLRSAPSPEHRSGT